MVSAPSVGPIVFSLTGCGLSVAGNAPERQNRGQPSEGPRRERLSM